MKKVDRCLATKLEKYGVTAPMSFVLLSLLLEDGSTLKEIGLRSQIDSSSMTVLVDKLESDGLVERRLDPQDRRAIRVFLTPKGRSRAEELLEVGTDFNQIIDGILDENKELFIKGLEDIIVNLE